MLVYQAPNVKDPGTSSRVESTFIAKTPLLQIYSIEVQEVKGSSRVLFSQNLWYNAWLHIRPSFMFVIYSVLLCKYETEYYHRCRLIQTSVWRLNNLRWNMLSRPSALPGGVPLTGSIVMGVRDNRGKVKHKKDFKRAKRLNPCSKITVMWSYARRVRSKEIYFECTTESTFGLCIPRTRRRFSVGGNWLSFILVRWTN